MGGSLEAIGCFFRLSIDAHGVRHLLGWQEGQERSFVAILGSYRAVGWHDVWAPRGPLRRRALRAGSGPTPHDSPHLFVHLCHHLQVFFACTCATLALNLSKSLGAAITGRGHFGWFDKEVAFEVGPILRPATCVPVLMMPVCIKHFLHLLCRIAGGLD